MSHVHPILANWKEEAMSVRRSELAEPVEWPRTVRPRLSSRAAEFLREHPDRAERVVAAALEDAAFDDTGSDGGVPDSTSRAIPEALRRFIVSDSDETNLLSVSEASERLAVSRPTIYSWIEQLRLVAWRVTRRGHLIPAEQIVGPGELVPGIDRVLTAIPQPRAAWRFLTEESPFLPGEPHRPIDVLKSGRPEDVDAVIAATNSYLEAFT
jgi:excisionase family DNA binding protein